MSVTPTAVRLRRVICYEVLRADGTALPETDGGSQPERFVAGGSFHGMLELKGASGVLVVDMPTGFAAAFAELCNGNAPIAANLVKASPSIVAALMKGAP